jgi:hypothetical protein
MFLAFVSLLSVIASIQTGHFFATPFAMLFFAGYASVAGLVIQEQVLGRATVGAAEGASPAGEPSEMARAA